MKALITGGGGFLGSRIAACLHERGDEVTVLGRKRYPPLEQQGIGTVQCDVRDAAAVEGACRGVEVVFHVAAITDLWGPRRPIWETNVEGTRNVIEACRRQGVRRLVYTSTPSVVFGEGDLCGVNESQPYPARYLADYPASKADAEKMVLRANGDELMTLALRPHLIWGPGDPHLFPRIIERARRGRLVQVGDGRNLVDVTYIDNAVSAHVLACDALRPGAACAGKAYFISQGEPVLLWPWLNGILERLGIPPVRRSISLRIARAVGAVCELFHWLSGCRGEPRMTRFLAAQLAQSHYFDISAARRDVGYEPKVSAVEGVERMIASLRS